MTVQPLVPLAPAVVLPDVPSAGGGAAGSFSQAVTEAFARLESSVERADRAERAFVAGRGGLQAMVLERAQAGVALSVAGAAASRAAQALTTILGMQV